MTFWYSFNVQFLRFFAYTSLFCLFPFRNEGFLMATHLLSPVDWSWLFTVDNHIGQCQEKLNLALNSGAVFVLCLLFSINKDLSLAAVVTFGAPTFLVNIERHVK